MTIKFGELSSEQHAEQIQECREIVKRIMNFGVTNGQILNLIYLLALELENNEHVVEITTLVKSFEQKTFIIDRAEE